MKNLPLPIIEATNKRASNQTILFASLAKLKSASCITTQIETRKRKVTGGLLQDGPLPYKLHYK